MPQPDPNLGTVNPSTGRLAALGGLGFAVASIAGDLAIGPFPGPATPAITARLVLRRAPRPGAGRWHAARSERHLLRAVRPGRVGTDPAGAGQSAASRADGDRHHPGGDDHAGRRWTCTGCSATSAASPASAPAALQAWHFTGSAGSTSPTAPAGSRFLLLAAGAGLHSQDLLCRLAGPATAGWRVGRSRPGPFGLLPSPTAFLAGPSAMAGSPCWSPVNPAPISPTP